MHHEIGVFQMPKDGKKLLVIIDCLEDFAEKTLSLIADESQAGCSRLISMIETAKKNYKKPVESWVTGWFYNRLRGPEVDEAIKGMEAFPDAYTRLQEFKLLVGKGEWNKGGSFNYHLFVEIIKAIPGYEPLKDEEEQPIIVRLKDLISDRIDGFMNQYKVNQKLMEAREKERQQTQQSSQKSIEHVQVFNNVDSAKTVAMNQQSKPVFFLTFKNNLWDLFWVDLKGKVYKLEPSEELVKLLVDQNVQDVESLNIVQMKRLKRECVKTRETFLDKTQLLINPKDPVTHAALSNYILITKGTNATFILRGKPNEYNLSWINTLSQEKEIPLITYPEFNKWLNTLSSIGEEHIPQLKSYLLHVNTKKSLDMDDFKRELANRLSSNIKVPPKVVLEKPGRLDIGNFAVVSSLFGHKAKRGTNLDEELQSTHSP